MTLDEVMRLSGRELDAAVAELVFRTSVEWYDETPWMNVGGEAYLAEYQPIPRYSTDIVSAWEAIETAAKHRPDEEFVLVRLRDGRWFASWFDGYLDVGAGIIDGYLDDGVIAVDANPATAASRAALLAMLGRKESGGGEA